jgi:hypothetical protein
LQSEGFANPSFYPVSLDSQFQVLLRENQTYSGVVYVIRCCQNQEIPVGNPDLDIVEDSGVIPWRQQSRRLWKAPGLHQAVNALRRQTGTALGAATRNNLAAVGGGHTGTETVNALTLQYAWLKRSFHDVDLTIRVRNSMVDWKMNNRNRSGILCNAEREFNG